MLQIHYKKGYKYQITKPYVHGLSAKYAALCASQKPLSVKNHYVTLTQGGTLVLEHGYAWDGPSGPVWDHPARQRGSLVHDALYQLIREGLLDETIWRPVADEVFWETLVEDAVFQGWPMYHRIFAPIAYWGVRFFAAFAAKPKNKRFVISAPPSHH